MINMFFFGVSVCWGGVAYYIQPDPDGLFI